MVLPKTAWSTSVASAKTYKSYREWKQDKVSEAQSRLEQLKARLQQEKLDPNLSKLNSPTPEGSYTNSKDGELVRIENLMRAEQGKLETAKELTVSDYFAGYLAKLSDRPSAFKDVAGRLSPEEVAELMAAYANSVFGSQSGNMGPQAGRGASDPLK